MARSAVMEIQAFGFNETTGKLKRVSLRMVNAQPAFKAIEDILEAGEKRIFNRLRGKYVDTGALMESLTQSSANDAIRDAHAVGLDFGTAVWYARFHKDKRGKSPYLKIQPTERKIISEEVLEFIVGGMAVRI
jgi:hypothetical protein